MRTLRRSLCVFVALAGAVFAPQLLLAQGATPPSVSVSGSVKAGPPKLHAKVAFVDVERCVGENEDGLRAKATLKKFSDRKQMYISDIEERLKKRQDELQEMAKSADPTLSAKMLSYQRDLQSYNDILKRVNNEIAYREDQLFQPIEVKVKQIFQRIAEADGLDLIVDKKALPTSPKPDLDLTERVIREYNWGTTPTSTGAPVLSGAPASSAVAPAASSAKPPSFTAPL